MLDRLPIRQLTSSTVNHGTLLDLQKQVKRGAKLKRRLRDAGITHDQVAEAAGVGRTTVVHVLAGRGKSQNVIDAAHRLLGEGPKESLRRPSPSDPHPQTAHEGTGASAPAGSGDGHRVAARRPRAVAGPATR